MEYEVKKYTLINRDEEDLDNTININSTDDNLNINNNTNNINKTNEEINKEQNTNQTINNNENKFKLRKCLSIFLNKVTLMFLFQLIIIVLSAKLYIWTLWGCEGTQAECLQKIDQSQIKIFALVLFISAFLWGLNITFLMFRYVHFVYPVIQTLVFLYLCFIHDTGTNLAKHGAYNRAYLIFMLIPCIIIQIILIFLIKIFIKRKLLTTILIIIAVISFTIYIRTKIEFSCSKWNNGLKTTKLDTNHKVCQIKQPEVCWQTVFDNYLDFSYWLGDDCTKISFNNRDMMLKRTYIKDAKVIGYPRTEDWSYYWDSTLNSLQFKVLKNFKDIEKYSEAEKKKFEVIVDYREDPPKLIQQMQKKEEVAKERLEAFKKNEDKVLAKNVVYIFIDSLSRDHFRRKLVKTKAWLEERFENPNSKEVSYQFLRYHAVAAWTLANMVPAHFGVHHTYKGSPQDFLGYYKENGYMLGQSHNVCDKELYDLESGVGQDYRYTNFDHENNGLFCDPNFSIPGAPYSLFNGPFAIKRRCLYSNDTNKYVFDYGKLFWQTYKDSPKFLRVGFLDSHEGTTEVVKYMDDNLVDFLNLITGSEEFKDTMIIIMADHGVNMPAFYGFMDNRSFQYEKALPIFYIVLPREKANIHNDELKKNEQKMLTPYDINNTLLNICNADINNYNSKGKTIFKEVDDTDRTCKMFQIEDIICVCKESNS